MAKTNATTEPLPAPLPAPLPISQAPLVDLKDPVVAAVLAWLIPGWGHWYQGRKGKAVLYLVCILGTFIYGLYLGDGHVVYASWKTEDRRLPFLCQVGVGLPSLPAAVQAYRVHSGKKPLGDARWMAPPENMQELDTWQKKYHRFWELGTVYTMIAGLLNVLAIYDAWGGPIYVEEPKPGKKKKGEEGKSPPPSGEPPSSDDPKL